jgi:hypothetical protein
MPTTSSLFLGKLAVRARFELAFVTIFCLALTISPPDYATKLNKIKTLPNQLHIFNIWQNIKDATLALQTARAKSTKRNAVTIPPFISGQADTELNPARLLVITIVQGRKVSKVAAKVVRTTGPVNFGHAVATNQ